MPDYQNAKFSAKRNGVVAGYGANTNQGIVRNYNEDRVAIMGCYHTKHYTTEEQTSHSRVRVAQMLFLWSLRWSWMPQLC